MAIRKLLFPALSLCLLLAWFGGATELNAQNTVSLHGRVTDAAGANVIPVNLRRLRGM